VNAARDGAKDPRDPVPEDVASGWTAESSREKTARRLAEQPAGTNDLEFAA
jgi:hypothetical protein